MTRETFRIIISAAVILMLLTGCSSHTPVKKQTEVPTPTSPSKEIGKSFVAEALRHYQFVKDPEVTGLVNRIGYRIVKAIGSNPDSYHFLVVHEPQPNAFAIPGGYIFIFDGLLLQLKSEDELAGVLAHEIAHVERNHFFKDAKKIAVLDIATIAAILLGGGNMAAATIAGAANIDVRLQFSRENEAEADNYALNYLKEGGYSAEALLNFFDSLIRYERFNPQMVPAYISTHPDLGSRRDQVANFVMREKTRTTSQRRDEGDLQHEMNWRRITATLISRDHKPKEETAILQILKIEELPAEIREEAGDYLLAVTYMKGARFNEAITKYRSAIEKNRNNPVYYADLAYCYLKQQDLHNAREAAVQSLQLKANHSPAHVILGILEQDAGNMPEAINHLEEARRAEPNDLMTNFHLAMAYQNSGDAARGAFYSAQYFRINLNPQRALAELKRAKELAADESPLYYKILQQMDEIKREGL